MSGVSKENCESGFAFLLGEYNWCSPTGMPSIENCAGGCWLLAPGGEASTTHRIDYDLGADYQDLEIADSVAIFGLKEMLKFTGSLDVTVTSATAPFFAGISQETFNLTLADLMGVDSENWIQQLDDTIFTNKRQFWRITITTPIATALPIRKAMLGKALCFSRSPKYPATLSLVTDRIEARRGHFILDIQYQGINDIEKEQIVSKLLKYADVIDIVFWDREQTVLLGYQMIRAVLRSHSVSLQASSSDYEITLVSEEVL